MIIVFGGIKGGTGKSTVAFHLAVQAYLLGKNIETIDLDFPQYTFSRYYENRKKNPDLTCWEKHTSLKTLDDFNFNDDKIYIIDTPGRYSDEVVKAHVLADVIITPVNESLIDLDTIMEISNNKWTKLSHYSGVMFESRKSKAAKWFVVHNRSSSINSKNKKNIKEKLQDLSKKLNFEVMNGLKERTVFRELFDKGMTVMDLKNKLSVSHISARLEIKMIASKVLDK